MLKTTNTEFQSIQLQFTDQNNRPLEIERSHKYYTNYWVAIIKNVIFNRTESTENPLKDTVSFLQENLVINMAKN